MGKKQKPTGYFRIVRVAVSDAGAMIPTVWFLIETDENERWWAGAVIGDQNKTAYESGEFNRDGQRYRNIPRFDGAKPPPGERAGEIAGRWVAKMTEDGQLLLARKCRRVTVRVWAPPSIVQDQYAPVFFEVRRDSPDSRPITGQDRGVKSGIRKAFSAALVAEGAACAVENLSTRQTDPAETLETVRRQEKTEQIVAENDEKIRYTSPRERRAVTPVYRSAERVAEDERIEAARAAREAREAQAREAQAAREARDAEAREGKPARKPRAKKNDPQLALL